MSFVQYKPSTEPTPTIPDWALPVIEKAKAKGIKTDLTKTAGDIPLYHLLLLLQKFFS